MRSDRMMDQAEGLRRLLVRAATPVVTVAGGAGGLGATSLVINLAAVLAREGKDVLVLDENLAHDNVANSLALRPRYDLLHAVRGDKSLREVIHSPVRGMQVLPAARAMQELSKLSALETERLLACLGDASLGMDVGLVEGSVHRGCLVSGNLAEVARRHLGVRMEYLGHIPVDERLKRATQLCRPVVEAFPQAPAAQAFSALGCRLMRLPAAGESGAGGLSHVIQRLIGQARTPNMAHII